MKHKVLLVLLACGLVVFLVGCGTEEDRAMVKDFIEDWVRSKKMHPIDKEGNIDLEGIWNLGTRLVTGSVGDEETDAVLDAYEVIDNMHKADELMDEGVRDRDAGKMDQAINMRPGDWTYRVSRAGLALEQGDLAQYQSQYNAAQSASQGKDPVWVTTQSIGEFEQVEDTLGWQGFQNNDQCRELYGVLSRLYNQRADLTNSQEDRARAQGALTQQGGCNY
jgi:hypothetical protein